MLIERTKEKRTESLLTKLGEVLRTVARGLTAVADELQYKVVEREVKQ